MTTTYDTSVKEDGAKSVIQTILDIITPVKPQYPSDKFYWFPGIEKDNWDEQLMYH